MAPSFKSLSHFVFLEPMLNNSFLRSLRYLAVILLLMATIPACAQEGSLQASAPLATTDSLAMVPPYAFDAPDTLFKLPNRLREISGLTLLDDQILGAVQDEKGRLYLLNMNTGKIEDDPRFDKDGDYEDLARVGDTVYVLRSNGTLHEITNWRANNLETVKHKTALSAKHDTEGLVYDVSNNRLLIACKEFPGKGLKNQKAIYAFDLTTKTLLEEPVYTINLAALSQQLNTERGPNAAVRRALGSAFDMSGFKPSALGIHPVTGHLYVLSSVRKALVVLNADNSVEAVWPLSEELFRQPESLAFLPNGDLFIASEGAGKRATLVRYTYRP